MASEIRAGALTGSILYAHVLNAAGKRWNGSSFETYAAANYSTYAITMTEQGSSGMFFGTFPTSIPTAANYEYVVYIANGASGAEGDSVVGTGNVDWNGTASADSIAGSMSGTDFLAYVKRSFKRTDKDTELYEAMTDAISELRRIYSFDEDQVETTTTDTISVLGDFKLDMETNVGILIGDIVVVDGDDSSVVQQVAKETYDRLYQNPSSTMATRDKPKHFCIFAGQIYLGPVPDSVSYTYRLNYSKGVSTITSASTSVPFTKWYREPLRSGVLAKAWKGLDDELAATHRADWEFFKEQIQRREEMNQKGTGFVDYCGV
jgi:hypothetical protein